MSRKEFGHDDIFVNRVKTHPELTFFIYNSQVYINRMPNLSGSNADTYKNVPPGHISLYELNINRTGSFAYPFVLKDGYLYEMRKNLNSMVDNRPPGNVDLSDSQIEGSYPMSASITRMMLTPTSHTVNDNNPNSSHMNNAQGTSRLFHKRVHALYNVGKAKYSRMSKRFSFAPDQFEKKMNIVDIPSIFYGSSIKKGSVNLKYYVTGSLLSSATDERQNGELISNAGVTSGSVIGLVYYDEGILAFPETSNSASVPDNRTVFASSYFNNPDLDNNGGMNYDGAGGGENSNWIYFGAGANDGITHDVTIASASFEINFKGTSYKNSMTLMCHADKGRFNYSNNPSFVNTTSSLKGYTSSSYTYSEVGTPIKNIVSSSYKGHNADFEKVTYMTKIGIYDENDNLIMVAEMARPYKKEEEKDLTFKLKYDLL